MTEPSEPPEPAEPPEPSEPPEPPEPPEVRLANDIAAQFAHLPVEQAAQAVAAHVERFWDPRMVGKLRAYVAEGHPSLSEAAYLAGALTRPG